MTVIVNFKGQCHSFKMRRSNKGRLPVESDKVRKQDDPNFHTGPGGHKSINPYNVFIKKKHRLAEAN